jgi:hypothetical protein
MLSLAVKNAILVTLIILILHFMIKNYIVEMPVPRPLQPVSEVKQDNVTNEHFTDTQIKPIEPIPQPKSAPDLIDKKDALEKKAKEDELYKFVFDDSEITSCSPPLKETPYVPEPSSIKAPKEPCKSSNLNFDNMFINEYDNESSLNGGTFFGGLSGYEITSNDYVSYP